MATGPLDQTTFMHRLNLHIILFLFGILYHSEPIFTQEIATTSTDDLGNVSDAFQENFFEALKQKGIENYELALIALEKAEKAANKNPEHEAVVFFEAGKNLKHLKRYDEAEEKYGITRPRFSRAPPTSMRWTWRPTNWCLLLDSPAKKRAW